MNFIYHTVVLIITIAQIETLSETTRRLTRVYNANQQIKKGKEAYLNGDFKSASSAYQKAIEQYGVNNEQAKMNLAHAYYRQADNAHATKYYQQLTQSNNKELQSIAAQQLGNLAYQANDYTSALEWYKKALRANPKNHDARYNYELVKLKKQKKDQEQNQQQPPKQSDAKSNDKNDAGQDSQQPESKKSDNKNNGKQEKDQKSRTADKNGQENADEMEKSENGNQAPDLSKSEADENALMKAGKEELKKMGLSEEKAKMLLEAMKNSEIQFLQQQQMYKQKKKNNSKPAW